MTDTVPALNPVGSSSSWRPGMGLASKLLVVVGAAMALILLGLLLFSVQLIRHARDEGTQALVSRSEGLVASLKQIDEGSRKSAEQSFSILSDRLPTVVFSLADLGDGKVQLQHAGFPLEGNFEAVDAFAQLTGGVATVFQREGEDFRRISTSLKKEDGSRALNTLLDRNHPAYALMQAGKPYVGRAVLFGKTYMTKYEPVVQDGKTIGILFIGHVMDQQIETLQKAFQLAGDSTVATLAVEVKDGPRLGQALARDQALKLDANDSLLQTLRAEVQAGQKSGVLSDLAGAPTLAGEGVTHVGWALYEPWGWVVLQAQRDRDTVAMARSDLMLLWSLMLVGALLAAGGVWVALRRMVLFPLRSLLADVEQLRQNDYSRPLVPRSRDELGRFLLALEEMRRQLSVNMRQMEQSAVDIDAVAREVAKGNMELGGRTENAASSLQQTASSMGHLTDAVAHSADAARQANQLATTAADVAAKGGQAVHQVVSTMDDIQRSSQKIADIIGVIDGIAFQTNILALNAAVEAARAGEAGRGFAVVASEVRSLAGRSAQAAKEIKALITASVERVQSGTLQVQNAGQTMQEIVASVQRVTDVIAEITAAAAEQSTGIGQVNTAVGQLDHMTQQNASLVEEVAAAADSLSHQTMRLREALAHFRTGNDGVPDSALVQRPAKQIGQAAPKVSASAPAGLPAPKRHPQAQAPRLGGGDSSATKTVAKKSVIKSAGGQKGSGSKTASASPPAVAPKGPGRPAVPLGGDWESF
ncbi:MAG TPA: methyl-accepting chemotaxis protein [Burkholderiaceae bacterium]|nr:methyl-accepting chemotaxis protein [Burkholderiaceae bacterium]